MRRNLPVTATEYEMADGKPIVSKTDLKGKITYVNPYFIEVSGFPEEELIGAPHNLVRHPDMPPEAFEDLWLTLKAGIPWTGLVKNRRKNGDYYWVVANVTPVIENGQTTGYMSVRTKPSRAQIEAAGDLYARMVAGNAKGIGIRQGNAEPVGVTAMFFKLRNMSLRMRFSLLLGMMMVLFGGMGLAGMSASDAGMINWFSAAAILGIVGVLLTAYLLHASIALPLQSAIKAARTIAGGDLTGKIASGRNDDMGQLLKALQQMNVNLVAIIGDVMRNVASMGTATREIATGNMDLSNRTESQASSLEETAASMEELSSTVRQNAENARQANRLALSASEVAVKGKDSVARVGTTMSDISEASKKIVDIIGLIDSIAFQTNILALNAAVEAARAGEQGKGFAVVATEVRSLAQRTAGAAKEIKTLIGNSMEKVELGNRMVNEAGETMMEIVHSVEGVTTIMNDIASSSHEQSSGIEQVNQAVSHMDEVTQQNAAMVEQAAAAAASLDEQAVQLSQAVSVFHFGGENLHGTQEAALPSNVRPLKQLPASRAPRSRQLTNEKVAAYR